MASKQKKVKDQKRITEAIGGKNWNHQALNHLKAQIFYSFWKMAHKSHDEYDFEA